MNSQTLQLGAASVNSQIPQQDVASVHGQMPQVPINQLATTNALETANNK